MKRIRYYSTAIKEYLYVVSYSLLRTYRYIFYRYYLSKLSGYVFLLCVQELREPIKADFDAFRDKYGFSEEMMGLLVHILCFEPINGRTPPFYEREYEKWYSKTDTLKFLLSSTAAWEKLQALKRKCPAERDLESFEDALFHNLIYKRFYLNFPLK